MSAIADLINKVLWQGTVYSQSLDLRAEAPGWDTVYPTFMQARQHNILYSMHTHRHPRMHMGREVILLSDGFIRYFYDFQQITWAY